MRIYSPQITLLKNAVLAWYDPRIELVTDIKAYPWITCAVFSIEARLRTNPASSSFKYFSLVHCFHQKSYRTIFYCFSLHLVKVSFFFVHVFFSTTDSFSQSLWKWKPTRIRSKIFQWNGGSDVSSLPSYQQAKYLHCAEENKWNNEVKIQIKGWGHTAETTAYFPLHQWREKHV